RMVAQARRSGRRGRRQVVIGRKRVVLPDQLRGGEALEGDGLAGERAGIAQDLDHADEAGRHAAMEADRRQYRLDLDHAAAGARADGRETDGLLERERLAQQRAERQRGLRLPMVEDENLGQHALDGARVDVGLIGNGAALAQAAPVTHQQMAVLVLHDPVVPLLWAFPFRNAGWRLDGEESEDRATLRGFGWRATGESFGEGCLPKLQRSAGRTWFTPGPRDRGNRRDRNRARLAP